MQLVDRLAAVLNTLNGVEVKGRDNLDKLLGCIQTLEATIMEQQISETEKGKEEVADG